MADIKWSAFPSVTPLATGDTLVGLRSGANVQFGTLTIPWSPTLGGTGVANASGSTITLGGALTTAGAFASTFTMTGATSVTFPTSGTLATVGGTVSSITGTANQVIASSPTGAVTLSLPQSIATSSAVQFASVQLSTNNGILDSAGLALLTVAPQASAVNNFLLYNNTTGQPPGLNAVGTDTNIGVRFAAKGTGVFQFQSEATTTALFYSGTGLQHITAFAFPGTAASQTLTFPDATGTVALTSQIPAGSPSALTKTDDTNVTLTLGGTPSTALLQATSLTLGWTGTLSGTRGGTGVNNGASTITLGGSLTTSGAFSSTFTMTAGTSVTFPTSGTLAVVGGVGSFTWNDISGTTQAATINNGYIVSNASQTTVTIPAAAAEGSVFAVQGKGAAGWVLQMNTGQTVHYGSSASSSAGSLASTNQWDSVSIVCVTANTTFAVYASQGVLTVA